MSSKTAEEGCKKCEGLGYTMEPVAIPVCCEKPDDGVGICCGYAAFRWEFEPQMCEECLGIGITRDTIKPTE